MTSAPLPLITLEGTFYRAVDPQYRDYALSGSRNPGRYSRADQPTLYLSSTPNGVEAAMIAHRDQHSAGLTLVEVSVQASGIFDLLFRIELYIEPWNAASVRTAERAGYQREGLLRSHQEIGGTRRDMLLYAAIRGG